MDSFYTPDPQHTPGAGPVLVAGAALVVADTLERGFPGFFTFGATFVAAQLPTAVGRGPSVP